MPAPTIRTFFCHCFLEPSEVLSDLIREAQRNIRTPETAKMPLPMYDIEE